MAGDCVSFSGNSGSCNYHNGTPLTQSPSNANAAEKRENKQTKSVGYMTIYRTETRKFELTLREGVLRYTFTQNGKRKEYLFFAIKDQEKIDDIVFQSEWWKTFGSMSEYGYYIQEQRSVGKKRTGYYRVIKKTRASIKSLSKVQAYSDDDWLYFGRRKPNEI